MKSAKGLQLKKIIFVATIEEIHDQEMYLQYVKQAASVIQRHQGEYIARSDRISPFSGDPPERAIIIAFNSMEDAKACFFSEEYKQIEHLRESSTKSRAFFIENS